MSDPTLLTRAEGLERELSDTEARLADPEVVADRRRYVELSRRYRALQPIVERATALRTATDDLAAAEELLASSSGDEREAWREEATAAREVIERLESELRILLLPRDPNDDRDVIVEIRGAEGGEEANLFARDLLEMYRGFAERQGWSNRDDSSRQRSCDAASAGAHKVASGQYAAGAGNAGRTASGRGRGRAGRCPGSWQAGSDRHGSRRQHPAGAAERGNRYGAQPSAGSRRCDAAVRRRAKAAGDRDPACV